MYFGDLRVWIGWLAAAACARLRGGRPCATAFMIAAMVLPLMPGAPSSGLPPAEGTGWQRHTIEGFIFDLLQLVELDNDGDPDVITEEEKGPYLASGYKGRELGVVWYENPSR